MSKTQTPNRRRKKRKAYTLAQVQRIGSEAIRCAQDIILDNSTTEEQKLRAVHAISNLQSSYSKLTESCELEQRLQKIEQAYASKT